MRTAIILLLGALLAPLSGCISAQGSSMGIEDSCRPSPAQAGERGPAVDITGAVRWVDLEGGFYGIVAEDGKQYDVLNWCEEFQKDGLQVRVTGWERRDMAGFHMWGAIIEAQEFRAA